jgi:hypothetical protein
MPPCSQPLTFLARSINRILEVEQKQSERWWGISTKSQRYSIASGVARAFGHPGTENLRHVGSRCDRVRVASADARELPMTLRAVVSQFEIGPFDGGIS